MQGNSPRIQAVDAARGFAIVLMLIYHTIFDISYFNIASIDLHSILIVILQCITGSLFVLIAGISMILSETHNKEGYIHHAKRGAFLALIAILITIATWIYPHEGYIKFGIIHLIALSTFIAPFFLRLDKRIIAFIGITAVIVGSMMANIRIDDGYLFWLGLITPDYDALDHYPFFPWFGVILLGLAVGKWLVGSGIIEKLRMRQGKQTSAILHPVAILSLLGRNSLLIYLLHQPLIIVLLLMLGVLNPHGLLF